MIEEFKNAILILLNRAKEQLTAEEYEQLEDFIKKIIKK